MIAQHDPFRTTVVDDWCVAATVAGPVDDFGDAALAAGDHVWCLPPAPVDAAYDPVRVVGYHRAWLVYTALAVPATGLERWRACVVRRPEILRLMTQEPHGRWAGRQVCDDVARVMAAPIGGGADLHHRLARLRRSRDLLYADERGRALADRAAEAVAAWPLRSSPVGDFQGSSPDALAPDAVRVLADWLDERGAGLPLALLVAALEPRAQ